MSNSVKGAGIASAAALLALSAFASAAPAPEGSKGAAVSGSDTVHCYGVHQCSGNADCKTTAQECKGQNECKGHGFKALAASECLSSGGVIGDIS